MSLPESIGHDNLSAEIVDMVLPLGFQLVSNEYHINLSNKDRHLLCSVYSPASLLLRTSADSIAINRDTGDSLFLEVKASNNPKNFFIEALPFFRHLDDKRLGADCLYVYRGPLSAGRTVARYAHDIARDARLLTLTPRSDGELEKVLVRAQKRTMPDIEVIRRSNVRGSGDPFLTVCGNSVGCWSKLVDVLEERNNAYRENTV